VIQSDGVIREVNLEAAICSCKQYQVNNIPCGHALAMIYALHLSPSDYFPAALSVATWIATYDVAISVVNTEDLELSEDHECNPPRTRHARGRPKKKRQDRGTYRASRGLRDDELELEEVDGLVIRPKTHCGTCGETGHNAQTCRQAHE
jgi:hypothetical protein